jgi:hypothetical protein
MKQNNEMYTIGIVGVVALVAIGVMLIGTGGGMDTNITGQAFKSMKTTTSTQKKLSSPIDDTTTTSAKKEKEEFDKDKMMSNKYDLFKLTVVNGNNLGMTSKVNREEYTNLEKESPGKFLYIEDVRVGGLGNSPFNLWFTFKKDPSFITFRPDSKAEDWVIVKARVKEKKSKSKESGTIVEMLSSSDSAYGLKQYLGKYQFFVKADGKTYSVESSTALSHKNWQTVIGVYTGDKIELYVGGKLEASKSVSGSLPGKSNQAHYGIGNTGYSGTSQFEGEIDNIYVWGN